MSGCATRSGVISWEKEEQITVGCCIYRAVYVAILPHHCSCTCACGVSGGGGGMGLRYALISYLRAETVTIYFLRLSFFAVCASCVMSMRH